MVWIQWQLDNVWPLSVENVLYYWHFECIYDWHFCYQLLLLKYAKWVSEKYSEQKSLTRKSMKIDLWNCFGIEHESLWGKTSLQLEISWQVILVFAHTSNKGDCCKKKKKKKINKKLPAVKSIIIIIVVVVVVIVAILIIITSSLFIQILFEDIHPKIADVSPVIRFRILAIILCYFDLFSGELLHHFRSKLIIKNWEMF